MNLKRTSVCLGMVAGSLLTMASAPAEAATLFDNSGIQFDKNTLMDFDFLGSQGKFKSTFGVYEVIDGVLGSFSALFSETQRSDNDSTNDWEGTCPTTVPNCKASFEFLAGKTYTFGLVSTDRDGTVYSTNALNTAFGGTQQAKFTGSSLSQGIAIAFDDRGNNNDMDFNDFRVNASVPEPATVLGLGLVGGAIAVSRRRKARNA